MARIGWQCTSSHHKFDSHQWCCQPPVAYEFSSFKWFFHFKNFFLLIILTDGVENRGPASKFGICAIICHRCIVLHNLCLGLCGVPIRVKKATPCFNICSILFHAWSDLVKWEIGFQRYKLCGQMPYHKRSNMHFKTNSILLNIKTRQILKITMRIIIIVSDLLSLCNCELSFRYI